MNTKHIISVNQHRKHPTAAQLIRWAGVAAMIAGMIFVGIQPIHPADALASVSTRAWAIITPLKTAMCLLFMVGITGIYARQVEDAGWIGLAGFVMLIVSWALQMAFIFAEAFLIPALASIAPAYVDGFFGILNSTPSTVDLGTLPAIYAVVGICYILGGLLFGIATFRAHILSRWASGLLVVAAAITPAAALIPHPLNRVLAVPTGLAFLWLGYALWSERSTRGGEPVPGSTMLFPQADTQ